MLDMSATSNLGTRCIYLPGDREGHAVVGLAEREDLVVGAGLLGLELVAGDWG
jgi:hypothetical protein